MSITSKFRTVFRGDVSLSVLVREALLRRKAAARRAAEKRSVDAMAAEPARLSRDFASLSTADLLRHFRERTTAFLPSADAGAEIRRQFPDETARLIENAELIVNESKWQLAGFGLLEFRGGDYWRRDPLGGKDWGLEYHGDVVVFSDDGADIRVLWELNRFGHLAELAAAFAMTRDERFSETFFLQVEDWTRQNPYGRGANWHCAMEVALRAVNLLAAFDIFRSSALMDGERLAMMLRLFDQHGRFTLDNNEFSFLATSNHYLSDAVGLFWIGTLMPELEHAAHWREFGLAEVLQEMEKQILPDGADFESSTGYHKFVAEMLLFTFLLAKRNGTPLPDPSWRKLRSMFDYLHGITRPDGRIPLIGDADGSQLVPFAKHHSDDASYLLSLACVVFDEPKFKEYAVPVPELLRILGPDAVEQFRAMQKPPPTGSAAFADAGAYVMRDGDLYLHLNANDTGTHGRGSHAHNDALGIELAACGQPFIVDPGSYVYNLDRDARHLFRSTAYHSTVGVDAAEQNTMMTSLPFVLGNQARPRVTQWDASAKRDLLTAEHYGYAPLIHRRRVEFDKEGRFWLMTDEVTGSGQHTVDVSFHLAPGLFVEASPGVIKLAAPSGASLLIRSSQFGSEAAVIPAAVSRNYGHREESTILRWSFKGSLPKTFRTVIVPASTCENLTGRLELLGRLAENIEG